MSRPVKYTEESYQMAFGVVPETDDLERTNCPFAGRDLHSQCGVCPEHAKPRFLCGCINLHTP